MCTPPPMVDDLIQEILLRLPPDDPACLARASLACASWRRTLTDAGFLRRYSEFHRTPPMLGFLRNADVLDTRTARFVPTSSFRPAAPDRRGLHAMAARHGRVLLRTDPYAGPVSLVVWDPVTDEQWDVPPLSVAAPYQVFFNAVVFCPAAGCDHLDCHGGPFAVAYVGLGKEENSTCACLYSSEAGEWGKPAVFDKAVAVDNRRGVLVGNAVYFNCIHQDTRRIVKYHMGRRELSVFDPPFMRNRCQPGTLLTATDDGKLGFAVIQGLSLYLWAAQDASTPNGAVPWMQRRIIDLKTMLMYFSLGNAPVWHVPDLIGFANSNINDGVVFVMTETGRVFSVELASGRYRKTSFPRFHNGDHGGGAILIPYMSFYTPDRAKDHHRREEASCSN